MLRNMTSPYEWGTAEEKKQTIRRVRALTSPQIIRIVDLVLDLLESGSFSRNKMNQVAELYNLFWVMKNGNKGK